MDYDYMVVNSMSAKP